MAELLEKIPAEKRWSITAKALTRLIALRIHKAAHLLGIGEGIISPIWGWEKYEEINTKIWAEGGKKFWPIVKEMFNIPVEDAIGAVKLRIVATTLTNGPELQYEIVESTPKRTVIRFTQCAYCVRYKEFGINPELSACPEGHQANAEEGLKAINPKLSNKLTKAIPRGDPYCEEIFEFKNE